MENHKWKNYYESAPVKLKKRFNGASEMTSVKQKRRFNWTGENMKKGQIRFRDFVMKILFHSNGLGGYQV